MFQKLFVFFTCLSFNVFGDTMPIKKEFNDFTLLKVSPIYNDLDYAALMSSKAFIHKKLGSEDWPSHDFKKQQNLTTLIEDLEQFDLGKNFTFHIFDKSQQIIGCIYITPNRDTSNVLSFEAFYWLVPKYQKSKLSKELISSITHWISTEFEQHTSIQFPLN